MLLELGKINNCTISSGGIVIHSKIKAIQYLKDNGIVVFLMHHLKVSTDYFLGLTPKRNHRIKKEKFKNYL